MISEKWQKIYSVKGRSTLEMGVCYKNMILWGKQKTNSNCQDLIRNCRLVICFRSIFTCCYASFTLSLDWPNEFYPKASKQKICRIVTSITFSSLEATGVKLEVWNLVNIFTVIILANGHQFRENLEGATFAISFGKTLSWNINVFKMWLQ